MERNNIHVGENQFREADVILDREEQKRIAEKIFALEDQNLRKQIDVEEIDQQSKFKNSHKNFFESKFSLKNALVDEESENNIVEDADTFAEKDDEYGVEIVKARERMIEFRQKKFSLAAEEYVFLDKTKGILEQEMRLANKKDLKNKAKNIICNNLLDCRDEINAFDQKSPEAAYIKEGWAYREELRELKENRVVQTPFVKRNISRIKDNIKNGNNTLVLGHLGCGKTEMAKVAAREYTIEHRAQLEAEKALAESDLKNAGIEDQAIYLEREKRKNIREIKHKLNAGDPEYNQAFEPLFIVGSKDLTYQELLYENTLVLQDGNVKDISGAMEEIEHEIQKWNEMHADELASDPGSAYEKRARAQSEIAMLYANKNSAYGTVVKQVEKQIIQGMKEGRPVIIDEGNAIMPGVLIALNDILQRKPGEKTTIAGYNEPITIQEGFAIIMTGNETTGNVDYYGTNELNAAFRSRFDVVSYDYLPQNIVGGLETRKNPEKDELFRVILESIADKEDGYIEIPDKEKNLERLYSLAQLAKETQQIFSGKMKDTGYYNKVATTATGDETILQLQDYVMSLRAIKSVLEKWDNGKCDFDKALWDGYIGAISSPAEQRLTIRLAKNHNFFAESKGWKKIPDDEEYCIEYDEICPEDNYYRVGKTEIITEKEVLQLIYGKHERIEYPEEFEFNLDIEESEGLDDVEISSEMIKEIESKMKILNDEILALEILGEQCGCTKEMTTE